MKTLRFPAAVAAALLAAFGAITVPAPALAGTPLPAPGTPVASEVTTTGVTFSWAAPAGPVASYTIQVIDGYVPWRDLDTTTATSYAHTGLDPDTVYRYRIIAEPAPGSGYAASDPSGILWATTDPLPEQVPPTAPGTPSASRISTVGATIRFAASTDNHRVAGYWVRRQLDGVWTDWATNNIPTVYLRDLAPDTTYTVVAVGFDPNGNRSEPSPPFTFTTRQVEPTPSCQVHLTPFGQQYLFTVTVENMTTATVPEDWTVTFTLPVAHALASSFNATINRDGDLATAVPGSWYRPLQPGSSAMFGGNASYPAGSPLPSGFTLHYGAEPVGCAT